jgi:hypothetical protein
MKKAILILAVTGMFTAVSSSAIAAVTKTNITNCCGDDKDKKCCKKGDKKCCKDKSAENKSDKPK